MYLVLEYDLVDDYLERRAQFREEHLGLARAAHDRGQLALAGALTDPADRALLVWATEDPAVVEAFAAAVRPVAPASSGPRRRGAGRR